MRARILLLCTRGELAIRCTLIRALVLSQRLIAFSAEY